MNERDIKPAKCRWCGGKMVAMTKGRPTCWACGWRRGAQSGPRWSTDGVQVIPVFIEQRSTKP